MTDNNNNSTDDDSADFEGFNPDDIPDSNSGEQQQRSNNTSFTHQASIDATSSLLNLFGAGVMSMENRLAFQRAIQLNLNCEVCMSPNEQCPFTHIHLVDAVYDRITDLAATIILQTETRDSTREIRCETRNTIDKAINDLLDELVNLKAVLEALR